MSKSKIRIDNKYRTIVSPMVKATIAILSAFYKIDYTKVLKFDKRKHKRKWNKIISNGGARFSSPSN